jgi:PII-like signaling protein
LARYDRVGLREEPALIEECLKLTTYFAERDRAHGRFLADVLMDLYEQHRFLGSVLLRGVEGFGSRRRMQTQRLLTLSEDMPVVTVAVDTREGIQHALPEVAELCTKGLVTLDRGWMVSGRGPDPALDTQPFDAIKLTVLVGRGQRLGGRPADHTVIDMLHRRGVSAATAFMGIDGTVHGVRHRAHFGRNPGVPVVVVAVGQPETIYPLAPELSSLADFPVLLERTRICKLAGTQIATPSELPDVDPSGLPVWQKLMIHAGADDRYKREPLYIALIGRLREAGAPGATALRGFWGYSGDQAPHGDTLLAPRRRVPVVISVLDTPERTRRWFQIVDEVTAEAGLVTCEQVPAARAKSVGAAASDLALAVSSR